MLNRIPITAKGAEKLKAELEYLKKTARPNVVAAIAEAREKGDLSENAEYDAAREEQGHIEGRIAELEGKIPALQVIDQKTVASDRIVFGATVTLYNEDEDSSVTYQIVGDDEADIKKNLIAQLTSSVRWTECVKNMIADGADDFTECGPGKALQGMIGRIDKTVAAHGIQ